jgi:hypothetical protein
VIVGHQLHLRRPRDIDHRQLGRVVQQVDAAARRRDRIGHRVRRRERTLQHFFRGPAGVGLVQARNQIGQEAVEIEHASMLTPPAHQVHTPKPVLGTQMRVFVLDVSTQNAGGSAVAQPSLSSSSGAVLASRSLSTLRWAW